MEKRKSLMEKYEVPIHHLDFGYIAKCQDAREMEKIVAILNSGQEGHFPDLTKCAQQKLQELKPNSKVLRCEEQLKSRDCLPTQELKPIYEWMQDIKAKDDVLVKLNVSPAMQDLPPMRKTGKIQSAQAAASPLEKSQGSQTAARKTTEKRIQSTDYKQWDKYDADVELLRMDLEEERAKEAVQCKAQRSTPKIEEITSDEAQEETQLRKLSLVEREKYAEEQRLYGNEYFCAKEYEDAAKAYTRSINADPAHAARAYNNRAITHIKLKRYLEAIDDCELCLQQDPNNVKALLRLADANYAHGRHRESYNIYLQVLAVDEANAAALKAIKNLNDELGELPPANATRLTITELPSENKLFNAKPQQRQQQQARQSEATRSNSKTSTGAAKFKDYDLAELVQPHPNRVVKSKLTSAAEALSNITACAKTPKQQQQHQQQQQRKHQLPQNIMASKPELLLPMNASGAGTQKCLIEEI